MIHRAHPPFCKVISHASHFPSCFAFLFFTALLRLLADLKSILPLLKPFQILGKFSAATFFLNTPHRFQPGTYLPNRFESVAFFGLFVNPMHFWYSAFKSFFLFSEPFFLYKHYSRFLHFISLPCVMKRIPSKNFSSL